MILVGRLVLSLVSILFFIFSITNQLPLDPNTAQGAHVSVAAISTTLTREPTQQYLNALDKMHKIVLKAESEDQLQELVNKLKESQFDHYAWIEQPENILVAVASAPNDKTLLQPLFKAFKLFK